MSHCSTRDNAYTAYCRQNSVCSVFFSGGGRVHHICLWSLTQFFSPFPYFKYFSLHSWPSLIYESAPCSWPIFKKISGHTAAFYNKYIVERKTVFFPAITVTLTAQRHVSTFVQLFHPGNRLIYFQRKSTLKLWSTLVD